jgi:hypothetical protein
MTPQALEPMPRPPSVLFCPSRTTHASLAASRTTPIIEARHVDQYQLPLGSSIVFGLKTLDDPTVASSRTKNLIRRYFTVKLKVHVIYDDELRAWSNPELYMNPGSLIYLEVLVRYF